MLCGKQFGRYKIREKIGAGGMGEVYLAYDPELNRTVALKILASNFSTDDINRQRFKQEARAVSALNHPNILTIYEIGEANGDSGYFIATEYVEGQTLREYLKNSPLSFIEAVRIAEQIAQALVAAHTAGIVHRDIKPENVMIRHDSYVKVLDFGLAKTTGRQDLEKSENTTAQIIDTTPGLVMGSVRYMSPEQARGLQVDGRSDIWSLGIVLYEMLTGRTPFHGATTSDSIVAILHLEPISLSNLDSAIPPELELIVRKALRKEREERYQNIKFLALDLKNLLYEIEHEISLEDNVRLIADTAGTKSENPTLLHHSSNVHKPISSGITASNSIAEDTITLIKNHKKQAISVGLGLLLLAAFVFGIYVSFGSRAKSASFEKTQISRLSSDGKARLPAISPDGKYVAYSSGEVGNRNLVIRQIATDSIVTLVPATALEIRTVNFSSDGNYIFYTQLSADYTLGTLYQIPTLGGAAKKLIDDVDSEVSFSPDGKQFAFLRHNTREGGDDIMIAEADSLKLRRVLSSKTTEFDLFSAPAWSHSGDKLLISARKQQALSAEKTTLAEISLSDSTLKTLATRKWNFASKPVWLKDDREFLILARESEDSPIQIWRTIYSTGEVSPVTNDANNYLDIGISSDDGNLITLISNELSSVYSYAPDTKELFQLTAESPNLDGAGAIAQLPSGTVIFNRRTGKDTNLWSVGADSKSEKQLTNESGANDYLVASPNGHYLVFFSNRSKSASLWRMDGDGKNPVQLTTPASDESDLNPQIMPDNLTIIFQRRNVSNNTTTLLKIPMSGGDAPVRISGTESINNWQVRISPDGKHLAQQFFNPENSEKKLRIFSFDNESLGSLEKSFDYNFISSFAWSPDSRSLTYLSNDGIPNLWKLPLDGNSPQRITNFKSNRIFNFAWSVDGKRLLISRGIVNTSLVLIKDTIH